MDNMMEYKGYIGSTEYSESDHVFFGKVQDIRSLVSNDGATVAELEGAFREAVEDYLALCAEERAIR